MLDKPKILRTPAQLTAFIRLTIPHDDIGEMMGPGIAELMATVAAQDITPAGPWFTHHLRMDPDGWDFEICVPVPTAVEPSGRVQPGELAGATVARTTYRGPYEGLGPAWEEFLNWVEAEGHKPAPDLIECYVKGPESSADPAEWRTELTKPLVR